MKMLGDYLARLMGMLRNRRALLIMLDLFTVVFSLFPDSICFGVCYSNFVSILFAMLFYLIFHLIVFFKTQPERYFWSEFILVVIALVLNIRYTGLFLLLGISISSGNFAP